MRDLVGIVYYLQWYRALWGPILNGTSSILPVLNTDVALSPFYLDLFRALFWLYLFYKAE